MFVRLHRSKASQHASVQILESYREAGKVKQRILHSLGVIRNDGDRERLVQVAHALIAKLAQMQAQTRFDFDKAPEIILAEIKPPKPVTGNIDPTKIVHVRSQPSGFEDVYGRLCELLGFDRLLGEIDRSHKADFRVSEIVPMLVQKRLQSPFSKRRSLFLDSVESGVQRFELHQIYRAMDVLLPHSESFQALAFDAATNLLEKRVECFFYDATTLYFESVRQDEVRAFGFSKDGKFNQTQVLLCLIVTEEGLPVGYEIFPGNTAETKTMEKAVQKLSERYQVVRATIVCDRGMMSGDNLAFAEAYKLHYIVGEKLRKLPARHQPMIFEKSAYAEIGDKTFIRDVAHPTRPGKRLILIYSESRAQKDKTDRERLLKKLEKKLDKKKPGARDFISNQGVKKFITIAGGTAALNRQAILEEEKWDGFFGITTSHELLPASQVLSQYRGLWQVEEAFRVAKHDLSTRPIFHWTPKRIRAHILLCFIALVLERYLEALLQKRGTPLTAMNIHDALSGCQKILLQETKSNRLFAVSANKPLEARTIYETLGLNWRSVTREIATPPGPVVCTPPSVKPQAHGIEPF